MLQGIPSITCGGGGYWSPTPPSCIKSCGPVNPPSNGTCSPVNCTGVVGDQLFSPAMMGLQ